jgi:hypothetical protein
MAFGWPIVAVFTMTVALSMAELASSLPTPARCITGHAGSEGERRAGSRLGSISPDSSRQLQESLQTMEAGTQIAAGVPGLPREVRLSAPAPESQLFTLVSSCLDCAVARVSH